VRRTSPCGLECEGGVCMMPYLGRSCPYLRHGVWCGGYLEVQTRIDDWMEDAVIEAV